MKQTLWCAAAALIAAGLLIYPQLVSAQGTPPGQSPASAPRPKSATPQSYPADQIAAGEPLFVSQCGFCHGRDTSGGEGGPDLTRSELVAEDNRGDQIGPLLQTGRMDNGMPAFTMFSEADVNAIVAFIHDQQAKFAELGGGRQAVADEDLEGGDAAAGRIYFNGTGGCSSCHSATGDLAGVGSRFEGLALIRRMLYPSGRPAPARPTVTFTLESGETITAPLAAEDEFSITILDPLGERQIFEKDQVSYEVRDPMQAHFALLSRYTDQDMHNVYAYLNTLK